MTTDTDHETVRGHTCEGLTVFQNFGYACMPKFEKTGSMSGCDATNEIIANFCPFCGDKFPVDLTAEQQQRMEEEIKHYDD